MAQRLVKIGVIGIWAAFAAAILLLDWSDASLLYRAINVVGEVGLAVALIWAVRGGGWTFGCIASSTLLLLLYLVQWTFQVREIYYATPEKGLAWAIYSLADAWWVLFMWRQKTFGMLWALLALYWDVVIVVLQVVAVFALIKTKSLKRSSA